MSMSKEFTPKFPCSQNPNGPGKSVKRYYSKPIDTPFLQNGSNYKSTATTPSNTVQNYSNIPGSSSLVSKPNPQNARSEEFKRSASNKIPHSKVSEKGNHTRENESYALLMTNRQPGIKRKACSTREDNKFSKAVSDMKEDMKNNIENRGTIHLIGYVENVIRWDGILKNVKINVLYNVLGTFLNMTDGTKMFEKYVYIRGNNGTVMQCNFFEVDRTLPTINRGQFVGCFGQMLGTQKLKIYSIDVLDEEADRNGTQRVIFLSQRTVHEIANQKQ